MFDGLRRVISQNIEAFFAYKEPRKQVQPKLTRELLEAHILSTSNYPVDFGERCVVVESKMEDELLTFNEESVLLGQGAFGKVYLARHQSKPVAVKVPKAHYGDPWGNESSDLSMRREAIIASWLPEHPHVMKGLSLAPVEVETKGVLKNVTGFIMTLYEGAKSLKDYQRRADKYFDFTFPFDEKVMSENDALVKKVLNLREAAYQVSQGLEHLHKHNIVLRDLTPSNILIQEKDNKKFHLVIADFGFARDPRTKSGFPLEFRGLGGKKDDDVLSYCGTLEYIAPEMCETKVGSTATYNGYSVDKWSLGAVLYHLSTGKAPPCLKRSEEFKKSSGDLAESKRKDWKFPEVYPEELKDLILSLTCADPEKRLSWEEIYQHPFFHLDRLQLSKWQDNMNTYIQSKRCLS